MSRIFGRKREMGLLIVAAIVVSLMLVSLELSQGNALTSDILWLIGGFILVFTIAHLALCFLAEHADQILLPVTALLNGIGLVIIYRIDIARDSSLANRQVMWTLVGVVLFCGVLAIVRDHRTLSRYSYVLGLAGLILLALPLVWPQPTESDARIWISIGPFSVQPGEFAKILLIIFFAQLLAMKRSLFTVAGYRFLKLDFPRLRDLAPILVVWAFAILIMAASNDFGPALLLFATVLGMMWLATNRASWLLIGGVLIAIGATAVYSVSTKIQTRVKNVFNPLDDYYGTGQQLSNSLFGLSWGGLTGTGLGEGYPLTIPIVWSDFILSAVGEELGLIGLSAVLLLFALFVTRGFKAATEVRDTYGKLLAGGLSLTLAIQVFVVVGGISALLPMTGLTTPFMSAGGSSLMANYILLALLIRISNSARKPAEVKSAPPVPQAELPAGNAGVASSDSPYATSLFPVFPGEPAPNEKGKA
ncbi:cell division protein [Corynebacterium renale]|uniref:Cell division protein FtsW (Lipid II flippase) n=1 Tax=Corynebacterium renale TaxID=1724 RepID=A0A2A9DLI6_9CORY|nr:FtsW/RodA/SpoVE family cell cycle protein [Corynebacterium renale]PFG27607.1 cell division protein FtsW (lipid II flippase) [Corynebacterium renale]SQG63687.1 cell division protein [Corynebacterium renale]SQI22819.1 cell division protein [Corynebacterium renale]STD01587.1 cell division protein [Corynebacterium renale]